MGDWHLAQMNVATALYLMDDPRISEFVAQLDEINALAESSPGFVWRLQSDAGNAIDIQTTDDPRFIINMSVWQDVESLFDFAYMSAHRLVMAKRRQWFQRPDGAHQVLWWVEAGHEPTAEEGLSRLHDLDKNGANPGAFNFKSKFPPPDRSGAPEDLAPEPYCVGWS